jgi:hypothetical protein
MKKKIRIVMTAPSGIQQIENVYRPDQDLNPGLLDIQIAVH